MMRVAIDVSPLRSGHYLQHRVRGTGFYLRNLLDNLRKYHNEIEYVEFQRGEDAGDVDIVHYPYFEPFFITIPAIKKSKTIVTVHDLTPLVFKEKFPAGIKGNIKWRLQKNSLKKADAIITDSLSSKKDIASHFRKLDKKIALEATRKFKLPDKYILYVGDVTWNKNLPRLIEAVNKTKYPLVIVGNAFKKDDHDYSNPWNQDLKKAKELASRNNNIISLRFVEDEELVALYNSAHLFLMPSLYEGFGLPILEAMQSGCPVVCSDKGSLGEVAGNAAWFVNPTDVGSIIQGIEKVFEDEKVRKNLIDEGFSQAKKFSWKKTADETVKVYENVNE
jgi:glycosyltransferase involved in cell wall biosynthesis